MQQNKEYYNFSQEAGGGHIRLIEDNESVLLLMRKADAPELMPIELSFQQISELYALISEKLLEDKTIPMEYREIPMA